MELQLAVGLWQQSLELQQLELAFELALEVHVDLCHKPCLEQFGLCQAHCMEEPLQVVHLGLGLVHLALRQL